MISLNGEKIKVYSSILFFTTSIIYFCNFLAFPYKVGYSAFIISVSTFLLPNKKEITTIGIALFLSFIGDVFGAMHQFLLQMGFFALAHISYMVYFIPLANCSMKKRFYSMFVIGIICVVYMTYTIPHVRDPIEKYGMIVYSIIISGMLLSVFLYEAQDWVGFVSAGILFCFSDCSIGWNKYVQPFKYSNQTIMVTYYAAQYLFWLFALRREIRIKNNKSEKILFN